MQQVHDLDLDVQEYFEFKVLGYSYRFRHPTSEQVEELKGVEQDSEKASAFLFQFIEKVDDSSPDFIELSKKMNIPRWKKFREMITAELGG